MLRVLKAFTILEVLIVTAVIALLLALLLPSLARARAEADRLRCASNLTLVGRALKLYESELGRFPDIGDRDPSKVAGSRSNPQPRPPRWGLANIHDVAEALVKHSLARPEPLFCPSSLQRDKFAPVPFVKLNGQTTAQWKTGQISYFYLVGITMSFPDASGKPTFDPTRESPDKHDRINERPLNVVNQRTVLAGDRTVDFSPLVRNVVGSNHGRTGGWFLYTTGDVLWRNWDLLTPHPAPMSGNQFTYWYWPRIANSPPTSQ